MLIGELLVRAGIDLKAFEHDRAALERQLSPAVSATPSVDTRDENILALRAEGLTLRQIGTRWKLSPERVRQIIFNAQSGSKRGNMTANRHKAYDYLSVLAKLRRNSADIRTYHESRYGVLGWSEIYAKYCAAMIETRRQAKMQCGIPHEGVPCACGCGKLTKPGREWVAWHAKRKVANA